MADMRASIELEAKKKGFLAFDELKTNLTQVSAGSDRTGIALAKLNQKTESATLKMKLMSAGSFAAVGALKALKVGAVAAGAAIAGMSLYGKGATLDVIALGKELSITNAALGVQTDSMQVWGIAGQKLGINMEKVRDIFKDTSDKLGDFISTGGGEAKDIIEKLNLDVEKLRHLKPDEVLIEMASAMDRVAGISQHEKVFLMEAIANDASMLLPLLKENGKALDEVRQKAEARGQIISPADLEMLKQANEKISESKQAMAGLRHQFGMLGAEIMSLGGTGFTDFVDSISASLNAFDLTLFVAKTQHELLIFQESARVAAKFVETEFKILLENLSIKFPKEMAVLNRSWDVMTQSANAAFNFIVDMSKLSAGQVSAAWNREISIGDAFKGLKEGSKAAFADLVKDSELAQRASSSLWSKLTAGGTRAVSDLKLIAADIGAAWASIASKMGMGSAESDQKEGWTAIEAIVSGSATVISHTVENLWSGMVTIARASLKLLQGDVDGAFDLIENSVADAVSRTKALFGGLGGDLIPDDLKTMGADIAKGLGVIATDVVPALRAAFNDIMDITQDLRETIWYYWEDIKAITGPAWDAITAIISTVWDALVGTIKVVLKTLRGDFAGAWAVIESGISGFSARAEAIFGDWINFLLGLPAKVFNISKDIALKIADGLKGLPAQLLQLGKDAAKELVNGIKNIPGQAVAAGKDVVTGLANGIKDSGDAAVKELSKVGTKMWGDFKGFFGIRSPSRLMQSAGVNISEGLAGGITASADMAVSAASGMTRDVNDALSSAGKVDAIRVDYAQFKAASDARVAASKARLEALTAERNSTQSLTAAVEESGKAMASAAGAAGAATEVKKASAKATKALTDAEKARNAVIAEGKALTESLRTPNEQYSAEVAKIEGLLASGVITQSTYNRALLDRKAVLNDATGVTAAAKDRQDAYNKIMAEGKALIESQRGPQAIYNDNVAKVDKLLAAGAITQQVYNQSIRDHKKVLDDASGVTAKAKDRLDAYNKIMAEGKALIESQRGPQAIYNDNVAKVEKLLVAGAITQQVYNQSIRDHKQVLDDASGVTAATKDRQDAYNKVMEEGAALTRSLRTPQQTYSAEVSNLNRLLDAGAISQDIYNASLLNHKESLNEATGATKAQAEAAENLNAVYTNIGDTLLDGLLTGDWKSAGESLLSSLEASFIDPLKTKLSEGLSSAMSGGGFGKSFGGIMDTMKGGGMNAALMGGSLGMMGGQALGQSGIGTGIGGAIGSMWGPLGSAIGAGLGGLVESLFGGKKTLSAQGVNVGYSSADGFSGNEFKSYEKKRSFWRGTKRWTETSAMDSEISDGINAYFDQVDAVVTQQAEYFGKDAEALLASFTTAAASFSGDDIAAQVGEWSQDVTNQIYDTVFGDLVDAYGQSGEEMADTISRLITQTEVLKSAFDLMGNSYDFSLDKMIEVSDGLVGFAGGLDALASSLESYYNTVYTDDQRAGLESDAAKAAIDEFNEARGLLGDAAIDTAAELKEYVESLSLQSAASQEAYAEAIALSESIAIYAGTAQEAAETTAALAAELEAMTGASLIQSLAAQLYGSIDERYTTELARYESLKSGAESLRETIKSFTDSLKDPTDTLSDAQRNYNQLLQQAQSGDASVVAELNASAVTLKAALNDAYLGGASADLGVSQIIGQLEQVATTLDLTAGEVPVNSQTATPEGDNRALAVALVEELKTLSLAKDTSIASLMLENGVYASSLAESFGIDIGGLGEAYSVIGQSQLSAISALTDYDFGFAAIAESLGLDIAALSDGFASTLSSELLSIDGLSVDIKNQLSPYFDAIVSANNYDQMDSSILSLQAYISSLPDGIQGSLNQQLEDLIGANYLIDSSIKGLSLGQVEELKDYLADQGFNLDDVTINSLDTLSSALAQFDVGLYALVDGLQLEVDGISDALGSSISQLSRGIFAIDRSVSWMGKVVNDDVFEAEKNAADNEIERLAEKIFTASSSTALGQSVDGLQDFLRSIELESWIVDKDRELIASMDSLISSIETGAAYVGQELVDTGFNALFGNGLNFDINYVPQPELVANSYDVGSDYIDRDQLANIHRGEAIFTASQTGSLRTDTLKALKAIPAIAQQSKSIVVPIIPKASNRSGSDTRLLDEVRELRKASQKLGVEMIEMRKESRAGIYQVAKNTAKAEETLRRWDYDGQPAERVTS